MGRHRQEQTGDSELLPEATRDLEGMEDSEQGPWVSCQSGGCGGEAWKEGAHPRALTTIPRQHLSSRGAGLGPGLLPPFRPCAQADMSLASLRPSGLRALCCHLVVGE